MIAITTNHDKILALPFWPFHFGSIRCKTWVSGGLHRCCQIAASDWVSRSYLELRPPDLLALHHRSASCKLMRSVWVAHCCWPSWRPGKPSRNHTVWRPIFVQRWYWKEMCSPCDGVKPQLYHKNPAPMARWLGEFYPVLGLGSGGRLLLHFLPPVLYWMHFCLRTTVDTVATAHTMLTLHAPLSPLTSSTAKRD